MRASLRVVEGDLEGKEIPVSEEKMTVGRGKGCTLRLNTHSISRHHCEVVVEKGQLMVRDLQSTNGTFVNDRRIVGETALSNGDVLKIGRVVFAVSLDAKRPAHPIGSGPDDDVLQWLAKESSQHQTDSNTRMDMAMPDEIAEQMLARDLKKSAQGKPSASSSRLGDPDAASNRASDLLKRLNKAVRKRLKGT